MEMDGEEQLGRRLYLDSGASEDEEGEECR